MNPPPPEPVALDRGVAEDLEFRALSLPERARRISVSTVAEFGAAAELLKTIKAMRAEIDEKTANVIATAHAAHKAACAQKREFEAPLVEAEGIVKRAMSAYQQAEERTRRAEEARLLEINRRNEEEARLEEAARLEAAGERELADLVLEAPPIVVAPTLPPPPRVAGITPRKTYRAEVLDVRALCRAVGDGSAPLNLVLPNQSALNTMAVALKESFRVPGCRVNVEHSIAAGRK